MRWITDFLVLLLISGSIAGGVWLWRQQNDKESLERRAAAELRRMEVEIKYRAVMKETELTDAGWPVTIDPEWFKGDPPRNLLVDGSAPWLEIAGEAEAKLMHPEVRMLVEGDEAGLWYNPYQGIVRARVPMVMSDEEATRLYNRVNGATLYSIFQVEKPPQEYAPRPAKKGAEEKAEKKKITLQVIRK